MIKYNIRKIVSSNAIQVLGVFLVLVIAVSVIGYLGGFSARAAAFQMATGSYTGNGTSQSITEAGFQPDVVIIKSDTNAGLTIFTTSAIAVDSTFDFVNSSYFAGAITSLDTNGFSIGSDAYANSDTITYRWIAFTGSGGSNFKVGSYVGNGVDDTSIEGVGFQPDLVWVKRSGFSAVWRSSSMIGDVSYIFNGLAELVNRIQALEIDGFQVGTTINSSDAVYYYIAFKATAGSMAVGTYIGNGLDDDTTLVSGLGFQPEFAWIENVSSAYGAIHRSASISGDSTQWFTKGANIVDCIQDFTSDGLELGASSKVNALDSTYYYTAWASVSTPILDSLDPTYGEEGDEITMAGSNFGDTQGSSTVSFNGTAVTTYTSWSAASVVVEVPVGATTGDVTLATDTGTSGGVNFSVYPKITNLSLSSGNIGDTVTITGLNFEANRGSNTVTFNSVEVTSYISWSNTEVVVVVPVNASSGNIILTTTVEASVGTNFDVAPYLSSLTPNRGQTGDSFTLTGYNFGDTQSSSTVAISSTSVDTYTSWNDTQIVVTVPGLAAIGNHDVIVTTSVGASNAVSFEVLAGSFSSSVRPEIISISPTSFPANKFIGSEITIKGNYFLEGIYASLYNVQTSWITLNTISLKENILKIKIPTNISLEEIIYDLVLTNPGGSQGLVEKLIQVTEAEVTEEVLEEEPAAEEEVAEEQELVAPSTADSADIPLLTEQLSFLKKQYNQVVDLLKFFGRLFLVTNRDSVFESTYQYEIDFQSPNPSLAVGETGSVTVSVRNIGTDTWYRDGIYPISLGTSDSLDRISIFATDSWFGDNNRPAVLEEESVTSNGLGTFVVSLKASSTPGTYVESFKLVAENLLWLSGPEISWTIIVTR